jgi:hypothetical protein
VFQKTVDGGSGGSSGVDNVINKNDGFSVNVEGKVGAGYLRVNKTLVDVVAVKTDVDGSDGNFSALNCQNVFADYFCNWNSAGLDSDKAKIFRSAVALKNLVRNSDKTAFKRVGIHKVGFEFHFDSTFQEKQKTVLPLR